MKKSIALVNLIVLSVMLLISCGKLYVQPSPNAKVSPDGRFIAYNDGTVLDIKTNLMWAAKDNGTNVDWLAAKFYCESYRGGGHEDWRLPALDELESLYNENKAHPASCADSHHVHIATEFIDITCLTVWASEISMTTNEVAIFDFNTGFRSAFAVNMAICRALPVRHAQ